MYEPFSLDVAGIMSGRNEKKSDSILLNFISDNIEQNQRKSDIFTKSAFL